jgi:hypothetical protein
VRQAGLGSAVAGMSAVVPSGAPIALSATAPGGGAVEAMVISAMGRLIELLKNRPNLGSAHSI